MTTPTNWPNPEQIGVPPNSDVSGWHWVMRLCELLAVKWDAPSRSWRSGNHSYYTGPDWVLNWEYCSPILTPTQLTELMAEERERTAKKAQEISDKYYDERENADNDDDRVYADERMCAAQECAVAIRNLGDAS